MEDQFEIKTDNINNDLVMIRELIKEVFNVDNIDIRSDLNDKEIILIAQLKVYADVFNDGLVKSFITNYLRAKLSKKRKSRSELVDVITKSLSATQDENAMSSKLLGKTVI